jgi:hypothetical protein
MGTSMLVTAVFSTEDSRGSIIDLLSFAGLLGMATLVVGTVGTILLAPLTLRLAPSKTLSAFFSLTVLGALAGTLALCAVGSVLAFRANHQTGVEMVSMRAVLGLSLILGTTFGGLTAIGWWWQLPRVQGANA